MRYLIVVAYDEIWVEVSRFQEAVKRVKSC